MAVSWDPIVWTNFVLCIVVVVTGFGGYAIKNDKVPIYIGIAFFFFAVSHVAAILGFVAELVYFLLVTRVIGYLAILYILYRYIKM